jgi:hypothetical protein
MQMQMQMQMQMPLRRTSLPGSSRAQAIPHSRRMYHRRDSDELGAYALQETFECESLLLGRVTWESFSCVADVRGADGRHDELDAEARRLVDAGEPAVELDGHRRSSTVIDGHRR